LESGIDAQTISSQLSLRLDYILNIGRNAD